MKAILLLLFTVVSVASTVDRLALVVGKSAFTQSEVEDEVRLNELETGKPLDLSAARRKEAAERMVDQQLLRDEISLSEFQSAAVSGDDLLATFCKEHFGTMAQCRSALGQYGVSEDILKGHLVWEVTAVRFTDQRFAPIAASASAAAADGTPTDGAAAADTVDKQMEAWLKERRAATRIVFKAEAYQ